MSELDHELLQEKLRAIADAEIMPAARIYAGGGGISAHLIKSALFVLMCYEGQCISIKAMADRLCCSTAAATKVLQALTRDGLVVARRDGNRGERSFVVSLRRLMEIQTSTPLTAPGGKGPAAAKRRQRLEARRRAEALARILDTPA